MRKGLVACLAILGLAACGPLARGDGVFHDRANDYKTAKAAPPLVVPEGMSVQFSDRYTIADANQSFTDAVNDKPPGFKLD